MTCSYRRILNKNSDLYDIFINAKLGSLIKIDKTWILPQEETKFETKIALSIEVISVSKKKQKQFY